MNNIISLILSAILTLSPAATAEVPEYTPPTQPGVTAEVEEMASHFNTRSAIVYDYIEDEVFVVDVCGLTWSFYGDDYEVGDVVEMLMYDNGTPGIMDDIIVNARYGGTPAQYVDVMIATMEDILK